MIKFYRFLSLALLSFTAFAQPYNDGVYVLNEGNFGATNASVSYLSQSGAQNDIYATANNNVDLGNTAQSIAIHNNLAYIVLNGPGLLRIADAHTMELQTTVTDLENPRYMTFSNGKGYISCWGDPSVTTDDYIAVLDLSTNVVITSIPAAEGVERILEHNGKIYVAHQGGHGYGQTVSVIDPVSDTVIQSIPVGDVPNSMVVKDNILYVLCGGNPSWAAPLPETSGGLYRIDTMTNTIIGSFEFEDMHPSNLKISGESLYYSLYADVYQIGLDATTYADIPLFSLFDQGIYGIYGMEIIDDKIYVADAADYVADGNVLIYSMDGTLEDTFAVGKLPNGFVKAPAALSVDQPSRFAAISVYPNPATTIFKLNIDTVAKVKLYDYSGRLIQSEAYTANGISVAALAKGTYVLHIDYNGESAVKKLIVN